MGDALGTLGRFRTSGRGPLMCHSPTLGQARGTVAATSRLGASALAAV